ncbi:MAG: PAC2 family protein [Chloroflexi bacterium]|nr:PAC2 family protein [Chloroflexota bacterium]
MDGSMDEWAGLVELQEKPKADEIAMIAGWHQWADAGAVSSGLPQYLIDQMGARKIGELKSSGFYLFQLPGTHDFLRPEVKLVDGYRQSLTHHKNEFYYAGNDRHGLVIFLGDEPHLNAETYAQAFFHAAKELGVRRVAGLGGVYGAMPYDKEREVSCVYSQQYMKQELAEYAVLFSNYEGGVSIGSYMADAAEHLGVEYFSFYSFVPAYDFSHLSQQLQGMRIENDYKAWHELMRRFNHMLHLGIDLTDLEHRSAELTASVEAKIEEIESKMPQLKVREYVESLARDFNEMSFMPLDVWERGLGDLFDDKS